MALRIFQLSVVFTIGYFVCNVISDAEISNTDINQGVRDILHSLYVKDPEDVVVARGKSATLRCDFKNTSPDILKVTWLHKDFPVLPNDTRRLLQRDGSLYIPRVVSGRRSLTGEYRCKVENKDGIILSKPAKLQIASFDQDGSTTEESIEVTSQQHVVLPCHTNSVPPAKIKWEFNKQPLPHYLRFVPLPSGALLLLRSRDSYAGVYRCIATNNVLNRTKVKLIKLTVLPELTSNTSLTFLPLKLASNTTVLLGQSINLYCVVNGWPIPKVQWFKDNTSVGNGSIFQIPLADDETAGEYSCNASNSLQHVTKLYNLQQKPYFQVTPKSKAYINAGRVKLQCQAVGKPEPCIYWLKNGKKLKIGGRIRAESEYLILSHTFTYDTGIYQCVAVNSIGTVWTSARVVLNSTNIPSPPENVQCRPYDESSICITWHSPIEAQAFNIYSFFTRSGNCSGRRCKNMGKVIGCEDSLEEMGPEYVTENVNYYLADKLNISTNYSFYIRLYSKRASDDSKRVYCETGVQGERNLQIRFITYRKIELYWTEISSDVPCGTRNIMYLVQWQRHNSSVIEEHTSDLKHNISGLKPLTQYRFRVLSSTNKRDDVKWLSLLTPETENLLKNNLTEYDNISITKGSLAAPQTLKAISIQATSVNLTWSYVEGYVESYTVYYITIAEKQKGEQGQFAVSLINNLEISSLTSDTQYEFKVKAHIFDGTFGPYSSPLCIKTRPGVLDLTYKIINDSAACIAWRKPRNENHTEYSILYSPNKTWPVEEWIRTSVPAVGQPTTNCWVGNEQMISTLLINLDPSEHYTVFVRVGPETGFGNPSLPIRLTTNTKEEPDLPNDITYHQKIGLLVGCVIAVFCIILCTICIVLRRRCVKRRNLTHARLAVSNNWDHPAVAHYASQGNSVQVRLENTCSAERHEIEQLVSDEQTTISSISPTLTHLDPKGVCGFPNGHINGTMKPFLNGHIANGHCHITENPQYDVRRLKEHPNSISRKEFLKEDSNSNFETSKIELFDKSKKHSSEKYHQCNPHYDNVHVLDANSIGRLHNTSLDSDSNFDLNSTRLTDLEDSFLTNTHRKVPPLLGPNG